MATELEKKEALKEICNLKREAEEAIIKAQVVADQYGVSFKLHLGGDGWQIQPRYNEKEDW